MKPIKPTLTLVAALAFSVAIITGCKTLYDTTPVQRPAVTNSVPQYNSADIVVPARTNTQTGVITPPMVAPGAQPTSTQTVVLQPPPGMHWEPNAIVATGQSAAGLIPVWGTIASLGIGLAASIGKAVLNRKEANANANTADQLQTVATSTFQAIEAFISGSLASGDPKAIALANKLKDLLAKYHDYADVMPKVQELLSGSTGFTGDTAGVAAIAAGKSPS